MKQFRVTADTATAMAQMTHNEIGVNGDIDHDKIIKFICLQYADWLEENIDWGELEENDRDTKEYWREFEEARAGRY